MRDSQGHYRYTPRGTTWKPCPACGNEPKTAYKIGSICEDCAYLIDWAKHEHTRYTRLRDMVTRLVPDANRINLPYCPGSAYATREHRAQYDKAQSKLARAIHVMLDTLLAATGGAAEIYRELDRERKPVETIYGSTIPLSADTPYERGSPYPDRHRAVLLLPEHAEAFDEFAPLLKIMVQAAYASGVNDGKELLTQLASGQITNDEFNEADVRVAKRVQEAVARTERTKR